jgi:hypothetical protein
MTRRVAVRQVAYLAGRNETVYPAVRYGNCARRLLRMKVLLSAAAIFALTAVCTASAAQAAAPTAEQIKAAAHEFDAGRSAFDEGNFTLAAEHFEAADSDAPNAHVLDLAIVSREKAGQLDRAATLAAMALEREPNSQEIKKAADRILKRAEATLGRVNVHCSSPCDLVVGTRLVYGKASKEKTVYLAPGKHALRAGWSHGRNASHQIAVAKGAAVDVSFKEPPMPPPAVTHTPAGTTGAGSPSSPGPSENRAQVKSSGWSPAVFWIGAGLTAALGGVTIWSGIDTQNNPGANNVRQDCVNQGTSCPEYQQGLSHQTRTNVLAAVTGGVGLATIVVGLFATNWSGSPEADQGKKAAQRQGASIEPWIGVGSGATLGAQGRF